MRKFYASEPPDGFEPSYAAYKAAVLDHYTIEAYLSILIGSMRVELIATGL